MQVEAGPDLVDTDPDWVTGSHTSEIAAQRPPNLISNASSAWQTPHRACRTHPEVGRKRPKLGPPTCRRHHLVCLSAETASTSPAAQGAFDWGRGHTERAAAEPQPLPPNREGSGHRRAWAGQALDELSGWGGACLLEPALRGGGLGSRTDIGSGTTCCGRADLAGPVPAGPLGQRRRLGNGCLRLRRIQRGRRRQCSGPPEGDARPLPPGFPLPPPTHATRPAAHRTPRVPSPPRRPGRRPSAQATCTVAH